MESLFDKSNKKFPKSPLRYPGGKHRAVKHILKLIPSDTKRITSPFFGGGSIEIAIASTGVDVCGYDVFNPLVQFWKYLLSDKDELVSIVKEHYPLSKEDFYSLQKNKIDNGIEKGAIFYVLNRASFSGSTLSGGMGPGHPRFTPSSIEYLSGFDIRNFSVTEADFHDVIPQCEDFMYLDPPYMIKNNLYGKNGSTHKDFDHIGLFELLSNKESWLLSYNNSPEIIEMYKGYKMIRPEWSYGMSKNKKSNELLIFSESYNNLLEV